MNDNHMMAPTFVPETVPVRVPLIGETAPAFAAHTNQGPVNFPKDYAGKWVILFSHSTDFTPVCATEFMTFRQLPREKLNLQSPAGPNPVGRVHRWWNFSTVLWMF